jgi:predicted nucleic acid-binding Zn ribbon protein
VKRLERIGIVLPEVLEDLGVAKRLEEFKAVGQWEKVAGRKIAERSQAVDVQNETLIVEVENNVWMQELVLLKPQILKKLAKAVKGSPIKDIRFRLKRT